MRVGVRLARGRQPRSTDAAATRDSGPVGRKAGRMKEKRLLGKPEGARTDQEQKCVLL